MTANEARTHADHMRSAILAARCAVVYFTKRDGTTRRMVCHVPDVEDARALTRKPHLLAVWDVEKGAIRTVNLATVQRVTAIQTRPPRAPRSRSMAEISALFDNGAPRKGERLRIHA